MSSCSFRDEAAADPHIESFVYHAAMPTDLQSIKSNQILGFNQSTARPNHAYRFAQLVGRSSPQEGQLKPLESAQRGSRDEGGRMEAKRELFLFFPRRNCRHPFLGSLLETVLDGPCPSAGQDTHFRFWVPKNACHGWS